MQLPVMPPLESPLETIATSDGWLLRSIVFSPPRTLALAVFIPAPGIQASLYVPVALTLAHAGVVVVIPTLRPGGHGARWGERAARDLLELLHKAQREYPDLPLLVGSHSTGCSVLLRALSPLDSFVQGVFLIAPLWGNTQEYAMRVALPGLALRAAVCLKMFALELCDRAAGTSFRVGGTTPVANTSPRLFGGYAWPSAILRMHVPLFAATGERDEFVPPSAVFSACDLTRDPDGRRTLITIPDADHQSVVRDAGSALRRWLVHLLRALEGSRAT